MRDGLCVLMEMLMDGRLGAALVMGFGDRRRASIS